MPFCLSDELLYQRIRIPLVPGNLSSKPLSLTVAKILRHYPRKQRLAQHFRNPLTPVGRAPPLAFSSLRYCR